MGLYSLSWIAVLVVIALQQMHVSADDKQEDEACSHIGIEYNGWFKWLNMPKELAECKSKMRSYFLTYTVKLVLIITDQLGKTYDQNKINSEKYEEVKYVLELFKDWDRSYVESTLNGTFHLVYAGGVKNIDRLLKFADEEWWVNVFPKEGVKKTRVTNFNASLIIDRLLKKERFKTTFTHALKWLDEGNKCDEYAMMELLEYEAERTERNYGKDTFFELFNAGCVSKHMSERWTESSLSEMLKHNSMYNMKLNLVINLLKVHRQLGEFIQSETNIWTAGYIATEMKRCNDTSCIQLTRESIEKASSFHISPNVYRKLYKNLQGQLITGDKICKFVINVLPNLGTNNFSNVAEDDTVEYLERVFHLKPWDSKVVGEKPVDYTLEWFSNIKWNLTDKNDFLRLATKYDFTIEDKADFLNLVGVTAPKTVLKALQIFGKWHIRNANFNGIWKKLKANVSNLWEIINLLEPAPSETQQLIDQIEITIRIYFENYTKIKLCNDTRIFRQIAIYQDTTKFIDTKEKRRMLIDKACANLGGFNKLTHAISSKTELGNLMEQLY